MLDGWMDRQIDRQTNFPLPFIKRSEVTYYSLQFQSQKLVYKIMFYQNKIKNLMLVV